MKPLGQPGSIRPLESGEDRRQPYALVRETFHYWCRWEVNLGV
jgi:hypothetical protein